MYVMKFYDFDVRIAYADTDRMGVVYYANYLVLFERGRTEFLRSLGIRYRDLEEKQRLFTPAMESHVEYYAPARYDDLIKVRTYLQELGPAHMTFASEIYDEARRLIARGTVKLAVVNLLWKPTRLPADIRAMLSAHVGRPDAE
jgi:acyl-CoA thioester hydrolase